MPAGCQPIHQAQNDMQVYSVAHQAQNWCMDYVVDGPAWMTFKQADKHWLDEEYPGVTSQPQSCAQLGFQKEHISPLYHVQKRTFQDKHTGVSVTNAYWERGTMLQELATNIHHLHTAGLLNSHANRHTTTNVGHLHGDRSSVITLSELNWFTNALAKAKEAGKVVIHNAADAAKHEGSKLANILITDAENQGHVLDATAKDKIHALSNKVASSAGNKIGQVDQKVNDMLEKHRNKITGGLIDFLESKGESLTKAGQDKVMAVADILDKKADGKVDGLDNKLD